MRKLILHITILLFLSNLKAQKNNAGAIAGAAAGIIATAAMTKIAIETYKEQLELLGTNYVLSNKKGVKSFNLKVLGIDGSEKTFDPSKVSINTFVYRVFDQYTGNYNKNLTEILLFINSPGWYNEYGVDYNKIRVRSFKTNEWNDLVAEYVLLASGVNIKEGIFKHEKVKNKEDANVTLIDYSNGKEVYLQKSSERINFSEIKIEKNKVADRAENAIGVNKEIIPFINQLDGDSYLVKNFSDDITLVYNEKSMGLFIEEFGELVQIKRSIVNQITYILNR